jgi:predicted dehydrogenase
MKTLSFAVIGVSLRGRILVQEALAADPAVRVARAADINESRLADFSAQYGCPVCPVSTDYREILHHSEIDAVIIASPDYLHEEQAIAALQAGKAVYLEKPMAITVEGCDRILRCAMEMDGTLYVGHNMRHFTVIHTLHCHPWVSLRGANPLVQEENPAALREGLNLNSATKYQ